MSLADVLVEAYFARTNTQLVRIGLDSTVPPPTPWNPTKLVRNADRIRAADSVDHVDWETYYTIGDRTTIRGTSVVDFQAVCNRVPPGPTGHVQRVMSLPADSFVFDGFNNGNNDGLRLANGGAVNVKSLHGSGFDNTEFRPLANSASRDTTATTNPAAPPPNLHPNDPYGLAGHQITISQAPGASITNMALRGSQQSITLDNKALLLGYNGVRFVRCTGAVASLYGRGGSWGWASAPDGETFTIAMNSDNGVVTDCEIDGRDDAGNRVGASPIGWNGSGGDTVIPVNGAGSTPVINAKVFRTFAHHGRAGMLTFWLTDGGYTEDYWAFSTAIGSPYGSGSGINHEMIKGTWTHVRPVLAVHNANSAGQIMPVPMPYTDPTTGNAGFGMSIKTTFPGSTLGLFSILEAQWDKAWPGSGLFIANVGDSYRYNSVNYHNTFNDGPGINFVKAGTTYGRKEHPTSGWNTADPAAFYAWLH